MRVHVCVRGVWDYGLSIHRRYHVAESRKDVVLWIKANQILLILI